MVPSFSLFFFSFNIVVVIFVSQNFCFLVVLWCHFLSQSAIWQLICSFTHYLFLNFLVNEFISDSLSFSFCFLLLCSNGLIYSPSELASITHFCKIGLYQRDCKAFVELINSLPMHPIYIPWKIRKSYGVEKGCIGNEWINILSIGLVGDLKITNNSLAKFEKLLTINIYQALHSSYRGSSKLQKRQ